MAATLTQHQNKRQIQTPVYSVKCFKRNRLWLGFCEFFVSVSKYRLAKMPCGKANLITDARQKTAVTFVLFNLFQKQLHNHWLLGRLYHYFEIHFLVTINLQLRCKRYKIPLCFEFKGTHENNMFTKNGCFSCIF